MAPNHPPKFPEQPEVPVGRHPPGTPAPVFPDPWPPLFAIHLYGLNWDFESWETTQTALWADVRGAVEQALSMILQTGASVEFAFDTSYESPAGPSVLSIGAWARSTTDAGRQARKRGLRASRTPNQRYGLGEFQIAGSIIHDLILGVIPTDFSDTVGFPARLVSQEVDGAAPCSFPVHLDYELDTPLGVVIAHASTSLTLSGSGGDLSASMAPIEFAFDGLAPILVNPIGLLAAAVGALALVYFVIQNVGSGQSAIPDLGQGGNPRLPVPSLRDLLIGPLHIHLTYGAPSFAGLVGVGGVVRIPFDYTLANRRPSVAIQAARQVSLVSHGGGAPMTLLVVGASTTDIFQLGSLQPRFSWSLDGRVVSTLASPTLILVGTGFRGSGVGAHRTFRIGVVATDPVDSSITAHDEIVVTGTVVQPPVPRVPSKNLGGGNPPDPTT